MARTSSQMLERCYENDDWETGFGEAEELTPAFPARRLSGALHRYYTVLLIDRNVLTC